MWSICFVVEVIVDHIASFGGRDENVLIQAFVADLAVEALYECTLRRLPGRDVMQVKALSSTTHGSVRGIALQPWIRLDTDQKRTS